MSTPTTSLALCSSSSAHLHEAWLCARSKLSETWQWGGSTKAIAVETGMDLWGGEGCPDGF